MSILDRIDAVVEGRCPCGAQPEPADRVERAGAAGREERDVNEQVMDVECPYCCQGDEPMAFVRNEPLPASPFEFSRRFTDEWRVLAGWEMVRCGHRLSAQRWTLWVTRHPGGMSLRFERSGT